MNWDYFEVKSSKMHVSSSKKKMFNYTYILSFTLFTELVYKMNFNYLITIVLFTAMLQFIKLKIICYYIIINLFIYRFFGLF